MRGRMPLAAVLLYATASEGNATGVGSLRRGQLRGGSSMAHRLPIAFRFQADTRPCVASLVNLGDRRYGVGIGEREFAIRIVELDTHSVRFDCDGLGETAVLVRDRAELLLQYRGAAYRIQDQTHEAAVRQGAAAGDGKIRASMNGRVVAVHVAVGDTVKAGQPVLTLEAMKMEHVHSAPIDGKVPAWPPRWATRCRPSASWPRSRTRKQERSRAMSDVVLHEKRGESFWITLNREEKRNALNREVVAGIAEGYRKAHADASVRAIVLTAAGNKAFCAGGDLQPGAGFAFDLSRPNVDYADLLRLARTRPCRSSPVSTAPAWPAAWDCSRSPTWRSRPTTRSSACPR